MNMHRTFLPALGLWLIAAASHAQSAPPAPPGTLSEESRASIARAAKAYADSLPPALLDAAGSICAQWIERGVDMETGARELFADEDRSPSTLPGMRWAWAQKNLEYVPPKKPGDIGGYQDKGTFAYLHAGITADRTCTVAYQILDTAQAGDPQDYAKRVYQWIGTLQDFTETHLDRDGARWVNQKAGVVMAMTSNEDDVIFLHYGRL